MADVAFRHTYRELLSTEQIEYMMDWMYSMDSLKKQLENGHVFHIVKEGEIPCGYMSIGAESIDNHGIGIFHLHKIYILPSYQGRGLGRLMLDRAKDFALKNKVTEHARIELNVNRYNKAVSFYRHYGMKILSQGDFHIGKGFYMNDYIMGLYL